MVRVQVVLGAALLLALGGCMQPHDWVDDGLGGSGGGSGGGGSGGGGGGEDDYCDSGGPYLPWGDDEVVVETCAGEVAERVFTYSLCSCTDVNVAGYIETRSFDSESTPDDIAEYGAPVGVNGTYVTAGYADVGGTFTVAGRQSVTFAGYLDAGGDLRFAGDVSAAGYIRVARDAWFEGDVTVPGFVNIGRDLHQPSGSSILAVVAVEGQRHSEGFDIAPPCRCGEGDILDVGAIVADGRRSNDNDTIGLDPGALSNVVGIGVELELPCGRFYVDGIGGVGGITLRVTGHTVLFVGGDVNAVGALNVEMAPEGELDLFIGGDLVTIGAGSFGSVQRPSATRIYVGGDGEVLLVGSADFVGNVYAPRSRITAVGAAFVHGSLFGRSIEMPGALMVHYDRHILDAGDGCDGGSDEPVPGTCDRCDNSCPGNRACVGGQCMDCRTDADCCEPFICWPDGSCGPLLY